MSDASYVNRTEDQQDVNGMSMFPGRASKEMLKISDTNRIVVSDRQGRLLNALHLHVDIIGLRCNTEAGRRAFAPLEEYLNYFQSVQLTRDSMSREDFKDIETAGLKRPKKSLFNRNQPSTTPRQDDSETDSY
jgi:hypothetical protein